MAKLVAYPILEGCYIILHIFLKKLIFLFDNIFEMMFKKWIHIL